MFLCKAHPFLVSRDVLFVLDLGLDILNHVTGLHLQGDGLSVKVVMETCTPPLRRTTKAKRTRPLTSKPWSLLGLSRKVAHPVSLQYPRSFLVCFLNPHLSIYSLSLEREEEREEGGREKKKRSSNVRDRHRSVASCTCPDQESNPQPRCVPWPFGVWGQCSNQLSHPARAKFFLTLWFHERSKWGDQNHSLLLRNRVLT